MTDNKDQPTPINEDGIPWKGIAIGGVLLLALFVAAPFMQIWIDKNHSSTSEHVEEPAPTRSNTADWMIRTSDGGTIAAATSIEAYKRYNQLVIADDTAGVMELRLQGLVFSLESGTPVTVINAGLLKTEVRPKSGKHVGKACWVPSEYVNAR